MFIIVKIYCEQNSLVQFTAESLFSVRSLIKIEYDMAFSYAILMVYYVFSYLSVVNQNRSMVDASSSFA